MVDVVIKIKFRIKKYFQVFNGIRPGYRRLTKHIIIDQYIDFPWDKYIILISFMLSIIQLAVHEPCTELMSDCNTL
jgi:hypothetical protein